MRILITIKASENGWNVFRIPSQEEYARWRVVRTCIRLIFVTRLAEAQARSKYSVIVSCQPVLRQNYRCFCLLFSWNLLLRSSLIKIQIYDINFAVYHNRKRYIDVVCYFFVIFFFFFQLILIKNLSFNFTYLIFPRNKISWIFISFLIFLSCNLFIISEKRDI